jgi:hypothetical protein
LSFLYQLCNCASHHNPFLLVTSYCLRYRQLMNYLVLLRIFPVLLPCGIGTWHM